MTYSTTYFVDQLQCLQQEHSSLNKHLQSVIQERDELAQKLQTLQKERDLITTQLSEKLGQMQEQLNQRLQALTQQAQSSEMVMQLQTQLVNLQQQQQELVQSLSKVVQEREELSSQLAAQTQQIEQLHFLLAHRAGGVGDGSFMLGELEPFNIEEQWPLEAEYGEGLALQKQHLETELSFALQLAAERQQWAAWEQELMAQWHSEKMHWQDTEQQLRGQLAAVQQQKSGVHQQAWQPLEVEVSERLKIKVLVPLQPPSLEDLVKPLELLLGSQQWQKADEETFRILLQVSQREEQQWLDQAAFQSIPKILWQEIDRLWREASQQRFGWSIQQRIWLSLGGSVNADERVRQAFGDRIGWRRDHQWLQLSDLKDDLAAPIGQYPALGLQMGGLGWGVQGFWHLKRQSFEFFLSTINILD